MNADTDTLIADLAHARATISATGVAVLSIEQAGKLNILGSPVINDLIQAARQLSAHPDIRVLILRAASDHAFVAGADIGEMATLDRQSGEAFISRLRDLCNAMRHFTVPVIARIPAWALGGGLELAMACDVRIASDAAHFGMPEVQVGIPSVIHAALMPRLIGATRASWMLLSGETIDAQQALSWGLVTAVVPADTLDAAVDRQAAHFAAIGPAALRQQKRLLRSWEAQGLDASIEASVAEFGAAFDTGEPQTFMAHFLAEKVRRKKS